MSGSHRIPVWYDEIKDIFNFINLYWMSARLCPSLVGDADDYSSPKNLPISSNLAGDSGARRMKLTLSCSRGWPELIKFTVRSRWTSEDHLPRCRCRLWLSRSFAFPARVTPRRYNRTYTVVSRMRGEPRSVEASVEPQRENHRTGACIIVSGHCARWEGADESFDAFSSLRLIGF